jgi:hypothetical protein
VPARGQCATSGQCLRSRQVKGTVSQDWWLCRAWERSSCVGKPMNIIFQIFISFKIILINSYKITKFIAFSFQIIIFFSLPSARRGNISEKVHHDFLLSSYLAPTPLPSFPLNYKFPCLFFSLYFCCLPGYSQPEICLCKVWSFIK